MKFAGIAETASARLKIFEQGHHLLLPAHLLHYPNFDNIMSHYSVQLLHYSMPADDLDYQQ
jgi:hypothetical protein